MSGETGGGLTAIQREALIRSANAAWDDGAVSVGALVESLLHVIERILADQNAALARVGALCDEAESPPLHSMIPLGCVRASEVRAALRPDPSPVHAGEVEGT